MPFATLLLSAYLPALEIIIRSNQNEIKTRPGEPLYVYTKPTAPPKQKRAPHLQSHLQHKPHHNSTRFFPVPVAPPPPSSLPPLRASRFALILARFCIHTVRGVHARATKKVVRLAIQSNPPTHNHHHPANRRNVRTLRYSGFSPTPKSGQLAQPRVGQLVQRNSLFPEISCMPVWGGRGVG